MKKIFLILLCSSLSLQAGCISWWKNREAVQLFKDKNYDEALQIYNTLIEDDPYNPVYNYNIGDVLYKQNRYEDAKEAFKRAADHAQNNIKLSEYALYGAGNSCYQLKKWQQAIDMYEKVLQLNPDNEHARHNLRLAQEKLAEEQLKDMQDKLEKNKDKQNQDQQKGNDQQDQKGDNPQDSSSDQSSDDNKGDKDEKSGQDQKSQDSKDSGSEKEQGDGKDKGDQKGSDGKSDDQVSGDKQQGDKLGKNKDKNGLEKSDQKSDDGDEQDESSHEGLEDRLKKNQQKLDDVESEKAEQESLQSGDESQEQVEKNKANDQNVDKQEQAAELQDGKNSGDQEGAKGTPSTYKKPELKNQLQELYEAKSSEDERLDSYYAQIMEALENQEENKQRAAIKNKVAIKMAGQHGKNSW